MNNCLCCGRPFSEKASEQELKDQWHHKCIRKFFGVDHLPQFDLTEETLQRLATETTNKGFTIPGVQKKLSLHLSNESGNPRLTLVNYPTGYILKPQTDVYEALPEAEYLIMQMAEKTKIETVPFALIRMKDRDEIAYITKRVDRNISQKKTGAVELLAMEDFCQLDRHLSVNKYLGSYERCAKLISRYSVRPGLDLAELFLRVVFSFITGNSDMHLKNLSLIETSAGNENYVLSPAYDMLPVNTIFPEDLDQMALAVNGKKRNIHRNDFIRFAETSGITEDAANKMITKVVSLKQDYIDMCRQSYMPIKMKNSLEKLIKERTSMLQD
jgi:serine/threonine-protein kinase HipA